jgi:hypothetical protein
MIEPVFLQVISKNVDYSKSTVNLTLFETSTKDLIRELLLDDLLNKIMNNEGYFYERRNDIRYKLNEIKTATLITHILGLFEFYADKEAVLSAVPYNDLTLDYLINYSENGDDYIMLLKQKEVSILTGTTGDENTITLDSDEVIHSIDDVVITIPTTGQVSYGLKHASDKTELGNFNASTRFIENEMKTQQGRDTTAYIKVDSGTGDVYVSMYVTVRKFILY